MKTIRELMKNIFRDNRGNAAVEFVITFPVLLAFFFGAVSTFDAFRASRLISQASTTVVDLITRETDLTDDKFDRMVTVAESLAGRYATASDFVVSVTSISNPDDPDDAATLAIDWTKATDEDFEIEDTDLAGIDLPGIAEGDSVIFVRVRADYEPPLVSKFTDSFNFRYDTVRRARFVQNIPYPEATPDDD